MNTPVQSRSPLAIQSTKPWTRSADGLLAGVCEGLAKRFDVHPWLVRLIWLVAIMAFGTGLVLYAIMAYCLPREDRIHEAQQAKILGVCTRLSRSTDFDLGLLRTLTVLLGLASFGATIIGYVILHFVVPGDSRSPY